MAKAAFYLEIAAEDFFYSFRFRRALNN
jgi:hypothetical protein